MVVTNLILRANCLHLIYCTLVYIPVGGPRGGVALGAGPRTRRTNCGVGPEHPRVPPHTVRVLPPGRHLRDAQPGVAHAGAPARTHHCMRSCRASELIIFRDSCV